MNTIPHDIIQLAEENWSFTDNGAAISNQAEDVLCLFDDTTHGLFYTTACDEAKQMMRLAPRMLAMLIQQRTNISNRGGAKDLWEEMLCKDVDRLIDDLKKPVSGK